MKNEFSSLSLSLSASLKKFPMERCHIFIAPKCKWWNVKKICKAPEGGKCSSDNSKVECVTSKFSYLSLSLVSLSACYVFSPNKTTPKKTFLLTNPSSNDVFGFDGKEFFPRYQFILRMHIERILCFGRYVKQKKLSWKKRKKSFQCSVHE